MIPILIGIGYLSTVGLSLGGFFTYYTLYERKKRKLGYVNYGCSAMVYDFFVTTRDKGLFVFMTLCPVLNFYWVPFIVKFGDKSDKQLSEELRDHKIGAIEYAEKKLGDYSDYNKKLALKIIKVKKANDKYRQKIAKEAGEYEALKQVIKDEENVITVPQRVINVRKLQNNYSPSNKIKPFSQYGYDEKISLLLGELEIALNEKAEAEGIDLDKEIKLLLQNPDESEKES